MIVYGSPRRGLIVALLAIGWVMHGQAGCDPSGGCDQRENFGSASSCLPDWLNLGGWIAGGWTVNGDGNFSGNGNAPYGYNNVSDGVVLNQLWFYGEKELDEETEGFDWGFRVDYLFGTDGPDNQAFGDQSWDFGWNSGRDYGSAIPQLYGDLKYADWSVRLGYFFTPLGYENVPQPLNFFYSHSFTFYYSEPNTHSGFLASYTINDCVTAHGGWTAGMDGSFENTLNASTFLGGLDFQLADDTSLSWMLLAGDWGDGSGREPGNPLATNGDIYLNHIILEHRFSERLEYAFHHDLGINSNLPGGANDRWYAIVNYLYYQISDAWQAGTRAEWFRDDNGVRIGESGDYYEISLGLNWNGCEKLLVRNELRWDWARGAGLPFDDGTKDEFFTYGLSGVLMF